jgi:hypothetical protein
MTLPCYEHSGCLADIENLKRSDDDQWIAIKDLRDKIDGITVRLNAVLGTLVVGLFLAVIELFIKK